jgi:hypothetical protein
MYLAPGGINSVDDPACTWGLREALLESQSAGHLGGFTATEDTVLDGVMPDEGFVG